MEDVEVTEERAGGDRAVDLNPSHQPLGHDGFDVFDRCFFLRWHSRIPPFAFGGVVSDLASLIYGGACGV